MIFFFFWWKKNYNQFFELSLMAHDLLGIPIIVVACELTFSTRDSVRLDWVLVTFGVLELRSHSLFMDQPPTKKCSKCYTQCFQL